MTPTSQTGFGREQFKNWKGVEEETATAAVAAAAAGRHRGGGGSVKLGLKILKNIA